MTNQEAAEMIRNDMKLHHDYLSGQYRKALNMAIDALLKEQEAVKPGKEHSSSGVTWWNVCGNCKTAINPNDKFCHECGKKVKWE